MKIRWNEKRGLVTGYGVAIAVSLGMLAFFLSQASEESSSERVALAAPKVDIKKQSRPAKKRSTFKVKPMPTAVAVRNPEIQFPTPTGITITVASSAQLVKLDAFQNPLAADAKNWNCVIDRTTNLVWEVKTTDRGLQDNKNYYSWFNPNEFANYGSPGSKNNGNCRGGISCDTDAYVKAINKNGLCGYADWRLPTRKELMSLIEYSAPGNEPGLLDSRYFPHGTVDWYWTSENDASNPDYAWYVLFYNGRSMKAPKHQAKRIRLVRGGQAKSFKDVAGKPRSGKDSDIAKEKPEPQSIIQSKYDELAVQLR